MNTEHATTARPNARLAEADRREQLLLYGREHFAAYAFDAQPMREIAERGGVSRGCSITTSAGGEASTPRRSRT